MGTEKYAITLWWTTDNPCFHVLLQSTCYVSWQLAGMTVVSSDALDCTRSGNTTDSFTPVALSTLDLHWSWHDC
jgi:hypothetical protein